MNCCLHSIFVFRNGGVIPHIAVHFHRENITNVVSSAVEKSGFQFKVCDQINSRYLKNILINC